VVTVSTYPNTSFFSGFNGARGWGSDSRGGKDASKELLMLIARDAEFVPGMSLFDRASEATVGVDVVNDRRAYVLTFTAPDRGEERLFFDADTGLLMRRQADVMGLLGPLPFQIDYEDYRAVDGIRLPFTIRWSRPGLTWSRKIANVRHNVRLKDSVFEGATADLPDREGGDAKRVGKAF
jgi:hypothetical protein